MYLDLGVPVVADPKLRAEILHGAFAMGYNGIAWNHVVDGADPLPEGSSSLVPLVEEPDLLRTWDALRVPAAEGVLPRPRQLKRLTMVIEDVSHFHKLSPTYAGVAGFDIVAVRPATEKAFMAACNNDAVDIISVDLSLPRMPYLLKPAIVLQAVKRGAVFEVCYRDALGSSRANFLANASSLVRASRGKGILITSGAKTALSFRGVYCVSNLATIFGLSHDLAKKAVSANAEAMVDRALAIRHTHKSAVRLVGVSREKQKRKAPEGEEGGAALSARAKRRMLAAAPEEKEE
jgi:ribonuclease P/MRP protein subunit RPP1